MKNVLEAAIKNKKDITSLLPDSDTRTGEGKKKTTKTSRHLRGLWRGSLLEGDAGFHESRK